MKKILSIILGVTAILVATTAFSPAADVTYQAQTLGYMPATMAAGSSTNLATTPLIDVRKQSSVTLSWIVSMADAGTSNVIAVLHKSVDGQNWNTGWPIYVYANCAGGTPYAYTTNIPTPGLAYLRVYSLLNTNPASIFTNGGMTYGIKTGL